MYNLEEKIKKIFSKNNFKISQKQKINFFDNLYNLINSWIPITNSFTILLYQTKDKTKKYYSTCVKRHKQMKKIAR